MANRGHEFARGLFLRHSYHWFQTPGAMGLIKQKVESQTWFAEAEMPWASQTVGSPMLRFVASVGWHPFWHHLSLVPSVCSSSSSPSLFHSSNRYYTLPGITVSWSLSNFSILTQIPFHCCISPSYKYLVISHALPLPWFNLKFWASAISNLGSFHYFQGEKRLRDLL
jgi:hypothetical protein